MLQAIRCWNREMSWCRNQMYTFGIIFVFFCGCSCACLQYFCCFYQARNVLGSLMVRFLSSVPLLSFNCIAFFGFDIWYLFILQYFLSYLCFSPMHSSFTLTFLCSFVPILCLSISMFCYHFFVHQYPIQPFSNYTPPSLTSSSLRNLLACGAASAWIQIPSCTSSNPLLKI